MYFFILFAAVASCTCRSKVEAAIEALPVDYNLKVALRGVGGLVSEEWLEKFSDSPIFGKFAEELGVPGEGSVCDRLVLAVPKLPEMTFEQILRASDVLEVARELAKSQKERPLFGRLHVDLEAKVLLDVRKSKEQLWNVLKDAKRTAPLRYQSVLMDVHDGFRDLLDGECAMSLFDNGVQMLMGCGRREAYRVIEATRGKWPQNAQSTPRLFFRILKGMEELAGDIINGADIEKWRKVISEFAVIAEKEELLLPEAWMHRLRMVNEGVHDGGFGSVTNDPWYLSVPLVLTLCLFGIFFTVILTIIIYYIFLRSKESDSTAQQ